MLTGLRPWMYWGTAFIWDFVCFLIPLFCFLIIYAAFDVKTTPMNSDTKYDTPCIAMLPECSKQWKPCFWNDH
uniref:Uncharacterized protein n=1 Tax=Steinernema glaseri TaxID=37863 RepID=A0A1I8A815_9BILA